MKRLLSNLALLLGVSVIVAPVAMTQTSNPYVLTAAKIAVALGYTPSDNSLSAPKASPTFTGTVTMPDGSTNTSANNWSGVLSNSFVQAGTNVTAGTSGCLNWNSRSCMKSVTDGIITSTASNGTTLATFRSSFTVATLPASPKTGAAALITDQLTACVAAGLALTGGGAVVCPVFYNGSAWVGD